MDGQGVLQGSSRPSCNDKNYLHKMKLKRYWANEVGQTRVQFKRGGVGVYLSAQVDEYLEITDASMKDEAERYEAIIADFTRLTRETITMLWNGAQIGAATALQNELDDILGPDLTNATWPSAEAQQTKAASPPPVVGPRQDAD